MHPYRIAGEIAGDNDCYGSHSQYYINKHFFVCDLREPQNLFNLVFAGPLIPEKSSMPVLTQYCAVPTASGTPFQPRHHPTF